MSNKTSRTLEKQYWLLKSEPSCYSIDDFAKDKKTRWTGIRNYQARNFMRDHMHIGDEFFFYHSSADPTAIVGMGKISKSSGPDLTARDKKDDHYDPKSTPENPIWFSPEVSFLKKFKNPLDLAFLKRESALNGMVLLQQGSRLSVQPVSKTQFEYILKLASGK
ncbi:MAG: EVE domain-containing protein [bacterium]